MLLHPRNLALYSPAPNEVRDHIDDTSHRSVAIIFLIELVLQRFFGCLVLLLPNILAKVAFPD